MLFENRVGTPNFLEQPGFGSHPLRPHLLLEVERLALFCNKSGSLDVVSLLGVTKQLFQRMLVGHGVVLMFPELPGRPSPIFGSESTNN